MKKIIICLILFILVTWPLTPANGQLFKSPLSFSLKDLDGLDKVYITEDAEDKLMRNGFVVTPGNLDEMYQVYMQCHERNQPVFITTDSVLHTSHIFFDYLLRILEMEKLYSMANELTDRMLSLSERQYYEAKDDVVKEMARLNIGFFAVAKKIFDPKYYVRHELNDLVNKELENIEGHKGIKFRNLLTYVENPGLMTTPYAFEDYSQYIPRGHYTRNEMFKKYFKVMMWYGRMDFKLKPGKEDMAATHGMLMTMQGILMADALLKDRGAYELWKKIYEPTVFFVGKSDDFSIDDYINLIQKVFSKEGPVDRFNDIGKLHQFIDEAMKLEAPKIVSSFTFVEEGDSAVSSRGFRLMGQRFIPDSYMFQQLVYGKKEMVYTGQGKPFTMEYIPNVGPARAFPRGLDVMAVLGSDRALEILREEGDTDYKHYYGEMNKLRQEFSSVTTEEWKQNLYWRWFFSLLPLLEERKGGAIPKFMLNSAWLNKELQTALGSWAELRHDTILYAKQSYTVGTTAVPQEPVLTYGYVEPYPRVYGRIAAMMKDLKNNLSTLGIEVKGVPEKIEEFEWLLSQLKTISQKELERKELSYYEYNFIWNIGSRLALLKRFPHEIMVKIASEEVDEKMDIIADVHTDPNTSQVLEEGVGQPFNIYVIIEDEKGKRLCRGAVFSYYEFKQPMDDRLTDERWQGMRGERPDQPDWVKSFVVK